MTPDQPLTGADYALMLKLVHAFSDAAEAAANADANARPAPTKRQGGERGAAQEPPDFKAVHFGLDQIRLSQRRPDGLYDYVYLKLDRVTVETA